VHGANRLGSNSLLEGMVFAARVVEAICAGKDACEPTGAMRAAWGEAVTPAPPHPVDSDLTKLRETLQEAMTAHAGVVRDAGSLAAAARALAVPAEGGDGARQAWEVRNLATVGAALVAAATARQESRGC